VNPMIAGVLEKLLVVESLVVVLMRRGRLRERVVNIANEGQQRRRGRQLLEGVGEQESASELQQ